MTKADWNLAKAKKRLQRRREKWIKILNLTLENFRGIKALSIDFHGKDTDIYGANGLGKTTIANAICWLLIDRPATEEPNFDPKTTGARGIHHTASIKMELDDGQEITLAKDFHEKFTRKKGSATSVLTGNDTDYYIDGVKSRDARVFIFDKGASSMVLTAGVGGKFFDLGNEAQHLSFQPLAHIDDDKEKQWAQECLC